jgi:hypothetical protein
MENLMKIIKGNLWDSTDQIILVTANSYINAKGELVMGRGAALELKNKFPKIAYSFGKMIKYYSKHLGEYRVLLVDPLASYAEPNDIQGRYYGIFQVKYNFKAQADLDLIGRSVDKLNIISKSPFFSEHKISMNFPGIGFGGRTMEEVLPIISKLNDKVTLYIKD